MLPLLPPLAIMAAFGLPTMKRGAINAIDWFSVMTLTGCAAFIWLFWIAKQTGWPAKLARNALKLVPGFKPEFGLLAFLIAVAATIGWIVLVHWRMSRQPSVLWRAVVLSSGGVILCWVLLMTLFLPWLNYGKSYCGRGAPDWRSACRHPAIASIPMSGRRSAPRSRISAMSISPASASTVRLPAAAGQRAAG